MWQAIIPSVISAAGSFIGGERRNEAQTEAAREQMAFQERMSSTAHQREVADLRAAGLNPILSAKHGGASSPGGAQPNIVDSLGEATRSGVSTGLQARMLEAQLEQIQAGVEKTRQDTATSAQQQSLMVDQGELLRLDAQHKFQRLPYNIPMAQAELHQLQELPRKTQEEIKRLVIENIAGQFGLSSAQAKSLEGELTTEFLKSELGRVLVQFSLGAERVLPTVNSALGAVGIGRILQLFKDRKATAGAKAAEDKAADSFKRLFSP